MEHDGPLPGWLARVRETGGSDLLLVAGAPPTIRVRGRLQPAADHRPRLGHDRGGDRPRSCRRGSRARSRRARPSIWPSRFPGWAASG